MSNTPAKSNLRWLRALMMDSELLPAARIAGAVLAGCTSSRDSTVLLRLRDEHRIGMALSKAEADDGIAELLDRGYVTVVADDGKVRTGRSFMGQWAESAAIGRLSFPTGKEPR